ncbi:hypothetical protein U1712_001564 [Enterobacter hormaechei subsp. hoffmannii]|uniref:hypothetical protein n=1 Tax=Enterobacter hormaechei TaxID=158836 RepID=UPI00136ECFC7|nr:hypothetical protein [Enterobacter hormaechei]EMA0457708.1 hypothetical protein [Enterobacter hormaechei subsp. hoffmannii]MDI4538220.1 hypothetical protein [Escherichia coli]HAS0816821.1 hypothetical protein [Enterobacter hormaechei subsp. xiangfangensis]HBM7610134.1 hypothetical protein [Enterobacter asburiae]EKV5347553.1 hypothetical protein [Enterobacter hormaechei]
MRKLTPIYTMVNFVDDAHFRRVWKHPKKTITTKQRAWVQYMMSVWGRINRGDDSPAGAVNVIGRLMIRTQWNPDMGGHIERMVNWLYSDEGGALRGEELYKKARELVIPQSSTSNIIALAKESDDAAFVEKVMVKLFHRESPVRDYAIKRYCERNCTQDIARKMHLITGLDIQACRRRVVWCENVLDSEIFYAMKREMENEIPLIAV